jgi:hypothetical protein
MIGLLCLGKPDCDAIEPLRGDTFFAQAMGIARCPSSATLRQRLDVVGSSFDTILKEESESLVSHAAPRITGVATSNGNFDPLDLDVSPFDNSKTKKGGVSWTYKGFDGFAPIFAYVGREGYLEAHLCAVPPAIDRRVPADLDSSPGWDQKQSRAS